MKKHNAHLVENLMEDTQALLAATAHVAEDKVVEARKRLSNAIATGKDTWRNVQKQTLAGVKATDEVIRDHPYQSLGVAFSLGALLCLLLRRRN